MLQPACVQVSVIAYTPCASRPMATGLVPTGLSESTARLATLPASSALPIDCGPTPLLGLEQPASKALATALAANTVRK